MRPPSAGKIALFALIWLSEAKFHVRTERYKWLVRIRRLNSNFKLENGIIAGSNQSLRSWTKIDKQAIPQDHTNQAAGLDHRATTHVVVVNIEDAPDSIESSALYGIPNIPADILKSVINNGAIPTARLWYPSMTGGKLDSGKTLLKIFGMIYDLKDNQTYPPDLCIIYPLPIHENISSVTFSLPKAVSKNWVIEPYSEVFYMKNYANNSSNSSIDLTESLYQNHDYVGELSSSDYVTAIAASDQGFVYTHNEFQSHSYYKLSDSVANATVCPSVNTVVTGLNKNIFLLSKAGARLLHEASSGRWFSSPDSVSFSGVVPCLEKLKVTPYSYSEPILVASNILKIFVTEMTDEQAHKMTLRELVGLNNESACSYLSLSDITCKIVDVAFDTSFCCKLFVLVQDVVNSLYVLLEHTDISSNGQWNQLAKFSGILPNVTGNIREMVILKRNMTMTQNSFRINGMSTLLHPDGIVYMWGDVLLVYDIRSGAVGWIPSFLSNQTGEDTAIQFSSANKKGLYSILTKQGNIWTGVGHIFERHFDWLINLSFKSQNGTIYAAFFNSQDKLFALQLTKGINKYLFERKEIKIRQDSSDSGCLRTYNCQKLLLQCDAQYSTFHLNHTTFSRMRQFSIRPPRLTAKGKRDGNIPQIHSKITLLTYLTVMERFFTHQGISTPNWWLSDEKDKLLNNWWYTQNPMVEQYRKYLHFKNSLPNQPMIYLHKGLFKHEKVGAPKAYEKWQSSLCFLPEVIYLDKDEVFIFTIILEHRLSADYFDYDNLQLVILQSDSTALHMDVIKESGSFDVRYQVTLIGQQRMHEPPGRSLKTISLSFHPWNPQIFNQDFENSSCCWDTEDGMSFEQNMLVKVGCPPGRRLRFDTRQSLNILRDRGRTDDFECYADASNNLPCFTTSEFAAAFYVEDMVTSEKKPFKGNYTLKVIAGGVGYLNNIAKYTEEEVKNYNYRPGESSSLLSLIWNVHSESVSEGMRDETTGNLIFDAKNPASIVFECRLDSPCGNIPLGASNPGEFYLEIEASNKGVDSSTNCDYTMRFVIRLIGIELSPRVHLAIMMVTLSIISLITLLYYACKFAGGYNWLVNVTKKRKVCGGDSDAESEYAEPPRQFRGAAGRRVTCGETGISSPKRRPKCGSS